MARITLSANRRGRRCVSCLFFVLALAVARFASAQGSDAEQSPEERTRLYDQLAKESDYLQKAANVLRKAVYLTKPTVVHIDSEHKDPAGRYGRRSIEEAGSGTIIQYNDKFYVLTNRHVVKDSPTESVKIKLSDGREINPTRVWMDAPTDIAILSIQAPSLVPARIGSANDMEVGDFVIAVGSPFGLSHSVTFGIVSAKGRRDLDLGEGVKFQDFLQTDAAINPGSSGGPLLNLKGEVIGINTAIASSSNGSEGIGFTIPIDMAMIVAKQLIDHGSVTRAYLGVKFYDRERDKDKFTTAEALRMGLTRPVGARISGVTAKSPAEAAKLQPDDVILEFNGIPIEDDSHLIFLVSLTEVGKEVPLVIFRNKQKLTLNVRVGDRAALDTTPL
jgi:serine protease Do